MFDIKSIREPETINELLNQVNLSNDLVIIAGGTDVLIKLRHGKLKSVDLVSMRKIKGLDEIKILGDGSISIGALSTFSSIFRSPVINDHIPILADAAVSMGGPQIRNMATIGGNICNGAVSADSAPSLFALNALIKIQSLNKIRLVPITEFYSGPGSVKMYKNEVLTEIIIRPEDYKNKKGCYIKFSNRKAMDISMLGVAVICEFNDKEISDLRISLGVAGPTPVRCYEAEDYGRGRNINESTLNHIGDLAVKASNPRDSWRCSREFRLHLIYNLTQRAIRKSLNS